MLYQSSSTDIIEMKSKDAKALFDYVHREHDSPTDFVKARTGKIDRKEHNAEYQLLLRMFEKNKPFSHKMWARLEAVFNIKRTEVLNSSSGHNTITGNNNYQASEGSTIKSGSNDSRIEALEKEIERLTDIINSKDELLKSKDEIIELYKSRM